MKLIEVTQQQRDNAVEALTTMWPSVPPENVSERLSSWRNPNRPMEAREPPTCGSAACFGGWCAWWPTFRAQGVRAQRSGFPIGAPCNINGRGDHARSPTGVSELLFGCHDMFYARDSARADRAFTKKGGSDHELVTHRLQWLIENSEVVS